MPMTRTMESREAVEALIRLIGQLDGLHTEIAQLAKKSPNDGVNKFKLKLINKVLASANEILGSDYRPFPDFELFDSDDLPTNSDVTVILNQYAVQAEKRRSDAIIFESGRWVYSINDEPSDISTPPAKRIGGKND